MASILAMTQLMQECASKGQWDDVCALHAQRGQWLTRFFSAGVTAGESEWISSALQRLLRMDQQIQETCHRELAYVSMQLHRTTPSDRARHLHNVIAY